VKKQKKKKKKKSARKKQNQELEKRKTEKFFGEKKHKRAQNIGVEHRQKCSEYQTGRATEKRRGRKIPTRPEGFPKLTFKGKCRDCEKERGKKRRTNPVKMFKGGSPAENLMLGY